MVVPLTLPGFCVSAQPPPFNISTYFSNRPLGLQLLSVYHVRGCQNQINNSSQNVRALGMPYDGDQEAGDNNK